MHAPDSPFIGREREIGALTAALERAFTGQGQLMIIAGAPGIGKTRTSQAFADIAAQQGTEVLWGRCYDQSGVPPYWPWRQVMRLYAQRTDSATLSSYLGSGAADMAEIVPEIKARFPDLHSPPPLEPEQARFRLFDSVTTFLHTASQPQPIVLILEDLHAADRSSLLLLEFVTRQVASSHLLIIGTYRDVQVSRRHPLAATLGRLVHEPVFN